jgi:hypothetical protein
LYVTTPDYGKTTISFNIGCSSATLNSLTYNGNVVFNFALAHGEDPPWFSVPKVIPTEGKCPITYTLTPSAGNTFMDSTVYDTEIPGNNKVKL